MNRLRTKVSETPEKYGLLRRSLFLQVRDELAERIATGTWKAGSTLPNEVQLSNEFGVSQGTIRKALDLLESERIVVRRQGRGTFVLDQDTGEMASRFCSVFNAMGQKINGQITCLRSEFALPDDDEVRRLRIGRDEKILRSWRLHSYRNRPLMYERTSLVTRHFAGLECSVLGSHRITSLAQRQGLHLSHAAETVRPVCCPEDVATELEVEPTTPVLHLERTVFTDRNVRLECRIAWCHLVEESYMSVTS
jgi:GntR family transcriptional regulator